MLLDIDIISQCSIRSEVGSDLLNALSVPVLQYSMCKGEIECCSRRCVVVYGTSAVQYVVIALCISKLVKIRFCQSGRSDVETL